MPFPLNTEPVSGQAHGPPPPTPPSLIQMQGSFNGVDGATSYQEISQNGANLAFEGNAELDDAQANSGATSLFLDEISSYGEFPHISAYDLSDEPWTIEGFVRFRSEPTVGFTSDPGFTICSIWGPVSNDQMFNIEFIRDGFGDRIKLTTKNSSEQGTVSGGINIDTWYHWAITRDVGGDDNIRAYFNGNHEIADFGAGDPDLGISSEPLRFGSKDGTDRFLDGWIDDVRFTIGLARYTGTGSYSIPSTPYLDP